MIKKFLLLITLFIIIGCANKKQSIIDKHMMENKIHSKQDLEKKPDHLYEIGTKLRKEGLYIDSLSYFEKAYDQDNKTNAEINYYPARELGVAYYYIAEEKYRFMDESYDFKESTPDDYLAIKAVRKYGISSRKILSKYIKDNNNDEKAQNYLNKINSLLQELSNIEFKPESDSQKDDNKREGPK